MQESTSSLQIEGTKLRGQDSKIYIIDTFPYNGELVTELRLKYLYGVVDEIMVVESRMTFSGKRKDFLYTDRDRRVFDPYIDKVRCSFTGAVCTRLTCLTLTSNRSQEGPSQEPHQGHNSTLSWRRTICCSDCTELW